MTAIRIPEDKFGRSFPYLRLSVTDVCNFKCGYCLPGGYKKTHDGTFLTVPEIRRLVAGFAGIGTWKIRLTGGEPTVRPDFTEIVRTVANVPGVQKLAFTTNGYKLAERAEEYYGAGLHAVNISVDTFDAQKFHEITGHDRLPEVLAGVDAARAAGFETKINAVLLKGVNDNELDRFLGYIAEHPVSLRFIELMQTGDNFTYFKKHHIPATFVRERLIAQGWRLLEREDGAGPALEYTHKDYKGRIGIIAPYAKNFCATCNRLRVSARGDLHLCLFGERGHALRPLLQDDGQIEELQEKITNLLQLKRETHYLHQGDTGVREHLASVGG